MAINLRREESDFQVTEVDPISKASQDYLKAEKEIEDLEALMKVKKEVLRKANENLVQLFPSHDLVEASSCFSLDMVPV